MTTPKPFDLDLRPQIARGEKPFGTIMAAVEQLAPGQPLRLIAPFRPVPLFSVMANHGFSANDHKLPAGDWEVLFTPIMENDIGAGLAPGTASGAAFWPDPVKSLDLTGMPPPRPMTHIFDALEAMQPGEVLFALLDTEPKSLFPMLALHEHQWAGNMAADGDGYRLLMRRGHKGA